MMKSEKIKQIADKWPVEKGRIVMWRGISYVDENGDFVVYNVPISDEQQKENDRITKESLRITKESPGYNGK